MIAPWEQTGETVMQSTLTRIIVAPILLLAVITASAQQRPPYVIPDDIAARKVDIYSEGARMTGYVYTLKSTPADRKLPTIIMAHGWGGTQAGLRRDAAEFARVISRSRSTIEAGVRAIRA
jgi:hypothetical protein